MSLRSAHVVISVGVGLRNRTMILPETVYLAMKSFLCNRILYLYSEVYARNKMLSSRQKTKHEILQAGLYSVLQVLFASEGMHRHEGPPHSQKSKGVSVSAGEHRQQA